MFLNQTISGPTVNRQEPCRMCGHTTGLEICPVDYWNLKESRIVKCSNCCHMQLDPMLTNEETVQGCKAYYVQERLREPVDKQIRNALRSFRRGIAFATHFQSLHKIPQRILELGPGTGYFARGIQYLYPDTQVAFVDVNDIIVREPEQQHQFTGYNIPLEKITRDQVGQYDMIIARDVIEHVVDAKTVIGNIANILKPGGYFHFITPNGFEDVWRFYVTWKLYQAPAELAINHVNYFDGRGLREFLQQQGFTCMRYYTYHLKKRRRGEGWRVHKKNAAPLSKKRSAQAMIQNNEMKLPTVALTDHQVLNGWWLTLRNRLIAKIYCRIKHPHSIKLNPNLNFGHEIFCIAQKK